MPLTDAALVEVLDRTVGVLDVALDVLAETDPLDLKTRRADGSCAADAAAGLLDAVAWPGTEAWAALSVDERVDWWVDRVGAVTTVAVAFPGLFGVAARIVPLGHWLGYVDQALILRAAARERGVTSRAAGVALLAAVLFDRDVSETVAGVADGPSAGSDRGLVADLWRIGTTLLALSRSLDSRPTMPRVLAWATTLPIVAGPVSYLGERIALRHAVREADRWIADRPGVAGIAPVQPV